MWRPVIYRHWSRREGRFVWHVSEPPKSVWTGAVDYKHRMLCGQAVRYCAQLNEKELSK